MSHSRRRSIIIGAAGFLLASLGVRAETLSTAVPPGLINGIADGADRNLIAHVNASGELAASDVGARARLDLLYYKLFPLAFGDNGLKVEAAGHVAVDNLPAVQPVSGTVTVANLPAQQTVAGTVAVSNFPSTQNVNVVGGMEIAPTTRSVGAHDLHLINDGKRESDWLDSMNIACDVQTPCTQDFHTTRFVELLTREDHTITLISMNVNRAVHMTCRRNGETLLVLATSSPVAKEFFHPLVVDECWLSCDTLEPDLSLAPECEIHYAFAGT